MLHPVLGLGLALGTADALGMAIPAQGTDLWCDTGQRYQPQAALIRSPVVPPSQEHSLIQKEENAVGKCSSFSRSYSRSAASQHSCCLQRSGCHSPFSAQHWPLEAAGEPGHSIWHSCRDLAGTCGQDKAPVEGTEPTRSQQLWWGIAAVGTPRLL